MLNGAKPPRTITSQLHPLHRFDATMTQKFAGLGPGGPVIYASAPMGPGVKEHLVRLLLAGLEMAGNAGVAPEPLILETTSLGQPRLLLGGRPGPAVSFSQADGHLWAALTSTGQVGVDVALRREFEASYPLTRAFRAAEIDWARSLAGGAAGAAALLWAVKEAAVKALGVGFHLLDPLDVEVFNPQPWQGGYRVSVRAGRTLPGWVRPERAGWIALALNY
jgi:phosphopantetheinyl transferase (holo-ACP synthase)